MIEGKKVAVVGCGMSPVGKGFGKDIDAHDIVIRCNRSYRVNGIEHDYGSRVDALVVGNPRALMREIPRDIGVPIVAVPWDWHVNGFAWEASSHPDRRLPDKGVLGELWPHARKPLCGTFAVLYAATLGAGSISLYGIDLYTDGHRDKSSVTTASMFIGHVNRSPGSGAWDLDLDREALLGIPCLTWLPAPPSRSSRHA